MTWHGICNSSHLLALQMVTDISRGPEAATTVARTARAGISNLTKSFIQKKHAGGEQSSADGARPAGSSSGGRPGPGLDGIFARMNTDTSRRADSGSDRIDDDNDDGGLLGSQPDSLFGNASSNASWLSRHR